MCGDSFPSGTERCTDPMFLVIVAVAAVFMLAVAPRYRVLLLFMLLAAWVVERVALVHETYVTR